jgi:hypothetical protein
MYKFFNFQHVIFFCICHVVSASPFHMYFEPPVPVTFYSYILWKSETKLEVLTVMKIPYISPHGMEI